MGHKGYWTGKKRTRESIENTAMKNRGKKWFNNGIINTKAKECPEGFVAGRIRSNGGK